MQSWVRRLVLMRIWTRLGAVGRACRKRIWDTTAIEDPELVYLSNPFDAIMANTDLKEIWRNIIVADVLHFLPNRAKAWHSNLSMFRPCSAILILQLSLCYTHVKPFLILVTMSDFFHMLFRPPALPVLTYIECSHPSFAIASYIVTFV